LYCKTDVNNVRANLNGHSVATSMAAFLYSVLSLLREEQRGGGRGTFEGHEALVLADEGRENECKDAAV
jgi:hypothetical protein